jgi:hypothetical protein
MSELVGAGGARELERLTQERNALRVRVADLELEVRDLREHVLPNMAKRIEELASERARGDEGMTTRRTIDDMARLIGLLRKRVMGEPDEQVRTFLLISIADLESDMLTLAQHLENLPPGETLEPVEG